MHRGKRNEILSLNKGWRKKPHRCRLVSHQHHGDATNGATETLLQNHGPKVYGVVQRTGGDKEKEVMARQWTVSHLQEEMKYIREVRSV